MDEGMIIDAACHKVGDGLWMTPQKGTAVLLEDGVLREVLREWRRSKGSEAFMDLIESIANGHEVTSPISPQFRYRAASLAGMQQSLL